MLRRVLSLASIVFALFLFAATGAAATAQRTFVASNGNDVNPCSIAAPCRGFARAITQTSSGGEVIVLDSAGYGRVTIMQSVSIIAPPGVYAGISVFAGFNGVTVSAGPTDKVVLRGLTITGQGGNNGIHVTSGKETFIEDCTIANLAQVGVLIEGGATVHIARAVVRSNGFEGVSVHPSAAIAITTTLTDSTLTSNGGAGFFGFATVVGSTIDAAVTRVTASSNATAFQANSTGGTITMVVADSIGADNAGIGVAVAGGNATAIVSGSSLVRNGGGDLLQSSSVLRTAGNNAVTGRGAGDILGTLTPNPLK